MSLLPICQADEDLLESLAQNLRRPLHRRHFSSPGRQFARSLPSTFLHQLHCHQRLPLPEKRSKDGRRTRSESARPIRVLVHRRPLNRRSALLVITIAPRAPWCLLYRFRSSNRRCFHLSIHLLHSRLDSSLSHQLRIPCIPRKSLSHLRRGIFQQQLLKC